ncbi:hypothetical protein ART_3289 [Arthrobacter sp. PAMC 25486]|uniref:hypothetical protein n=1 Tax=Arthrobacter sp. PAMC 25486 TaxID=1494608 RepID=UPI000535C4E6|nr:hypothetical protein [Arthrobacter sp. PAMC 25486]AIY02888.1 hypothetical protein ART_3289 [Arthrobacter sp. PAMC 25486]
MTKDATAKSATHKKWLDALTMELRLNDVSGKSIGDTLATVQEFLADSGQSPEEAFGTPREYAAELSGCAIKPIKKDMKSTVSLSTANLVVFLVFSAALAPWLEGTRLLLGGWQLTSMAFLAALVLALPLYLPFLLRHFWALIAVPVVGGAAGVLSATLTPKVAGDAFLDFPPGPVLVISAGLMVALSMAGTVTALSEAPDPVVSPLDTAPAMTVKARWLEILTRWLFPIFSVFLLGITALLHTLT